MKRLSMLWMLTLLLSGLATLTGCSSSDEDPSDQDQDVYEVMGLTRRKGAIDNNSIVVKLFERNGLKLQVVDITNQFESATFFGKKIPVNHIFVEQLPTAIQELAISAGADLSGRVCRMEYMGEYFYDIYNVVSSSWSNIFNSKGERHIFKGSEDYESFVNKATNICCILVLTSERIKDAEDAPNYLVGYWQNDWQHLLHDVNQQAIVTLYPDLPFSITEVMSLNDDGTGYLRTVMTYKDGTNKVALDPFSYVLTDYHKNEQYGDIDYSFKCYYAAGDAIEYSVRSYDNMQSLNNMMSYVSYPWFKQTADAFESLAINVRQKYGKPQSDKDSPIVGRWSGEFKYDNIPAIATFTWVFRSDNTGYRLLNGVLNAPFAYTVTYQDSEAELVIYEYNKGFMINEGFSKDGVDLNFDPTIVPQGKTIKAKINGNTLELEGWDTYQREG
ncbi:MAG: hypothetical protein J6W43_03055 [Prevotella sp.]|nr:hypothetical protein [Prevotella sp.]